MSTSAGPLAFRPRHPPGGVDAREGLEIDLRRIRVIERPDLIGNFHARRLMVRRNTNVRTP
jgi:hypothetical protein